MQVLRYEGTQLTTRPPESNILVSLIWWSDTDFCSWFPFNVCLIIGNQKRDADCRLTTWGCPSHLKLASCWIAGGWFIQVGPDEIGTCTVADYWLWTTTNSPLITTTAGTGGFSLRGDNVIQSNEWTCWCGWSPNILPPSAVQEFVLEALGVLRVHHVQLALWGEWHLRITLPWGCRNPDLLCGFAQTPCHVHNQTQQRTRFGYLRMG